MGFYYKSTSLEDRISIIEEISGFFPVANETYNNRYESLTYERYPYLMIGIVFNEIGGYGESHSDITNGIEVGREGFIRRLQSLKSNKIKEIDFDVVKHYFR